MTREELLSEIRKIEIASRNFSRFSLSGSYRSALKGSGMEIAGFKEYSPDDDYRSVDWNVSARSGKVYSRLYQEERENPLFFIVDTSASMYTGGSFTGKRKTKIESAAVVMAVIAFSAVFNNDRAGSVFCSDTVEAEREIGGKSAHIADMVFSLVDHKPERPVFDIEYALSCIPSSMKRGCCFVISDFRTPVPSGRLHAAGKKTDLVFIRITDPSDSFQEGGFSFPAADINFYESSVGSRLLNRKKLSSSSGRMPGNSETGTSSEKGGAGKKIYKSGRTFIRLAGKNREKLAKEAAYYFDEQKRLILKEGISLLDISTEDNIPSSVNSFFRNRKL